MLTTLISAESVWQDFKYGLRQLWSNPGFTAVAVATLALGIGVNTSIFSLLNSLMLRPLAVPDSAGLFAIYRGEGRPCSYPDFLDFERHASAFSGLAAETTTESALDVGDTSEVILAEAASYNYAAVLGIKPALGRWFTPADERAADFQAVISYRTWQRRFGGDAGAIGKRVRLESQWYTVIGVAPKEFQGMAMPVLTAVWVPLERYAQHNEFGARVVRDRFANRVLMFGRLRPGISASQAQGELNAMDAQLRREYPPPEARRTALRLEVARGTADPGYRRQFVPVLMLLSAVVVLVLLISCANVANLLLGRGVTRRREVSIRLAIGASRARICRQMLLESLLLSVTGAAAGLAAAYWTDRILERGLAAAPSDVALGATLPLDGRVLGFVLIASVVTTFLFGFIPAWQSSRPDLAPALKGSEPLSRNRRLTLPNLSVVAQVMLSLTLLILAGLFVRALRNATSMNPGFDAAKLLSARLYLAKPEFNETAGAALYRRVLDRSRTLPGVRGATLSYDSPMLTMSDCVVPDKADASQESIIAGANIVGAGYFSTFGIPLVRGREFTTNDTSSTAPVVIVNETLAHRYWPGQSPVSKHIRVGAGCDKGQGTLAEIVGVAKDAQYASLDKSARPFLFYAFAQHYVGYLALVIQTGYNPAAFAPALRKELRAVDGRLRIYDIDTVSHQIDNSLWQVRWEASLLSAIGILALLVASVGLYGVIAYAAKRRTREFGIRIAIGAQRRNVLQLVAGDALIITLVGVALGLSLALASTKLLRGLLFGLSPTDAATYAGAALLWTGVSLLAACLPAYRATHVDPSIALREE